MIDFSAVKAITVQEGVVRRILRGEKVLWSKPAFPAVETTSAVLGKAILGKAILGKR